MKGRKYGFDSRVAIKGDRLQAGVVLKCCFISDAERPGGRVHKRHTLMQFERMVHSTMFQKELFCVMLDSYIVC